MDSEITNTEVEKKLRMNTVLLDFVEVKILLNKTCQCTFHFAFISPRYCTSSMYRL